MSTLRSRTILQCWVAYTFTYMYSSERLQRSIYKDPLDKHKQVDGAILRWDRLWQAIASQRPTTALVVQARAILGATLPVLGNQRCVAWSPGPVVETDTKKRKVEKLQKFRNFKDL